MAGQKAIAATTTAPEKEGQDGQDAEGGEVPASEGAQGTQEGQVLHTGAPSGGAAKQKPTPKRALAPSEPTRRSVRTKIAPGSLGQSAADRPEEGIVAVSEKCKSRMREAEKIVPMTHMAPGVLFDMGRWRQHMQAAKTVRAAGTLWARFYKSLKWETGNDGTLSMTGANANEGQAWTADMGHRYYQKLLAAIDEENADSLDALVEELFTLLVPWDEMSEEMTEEDPDDELEDQEEPDPGTGETDPGNPDPRTDRPEGDPTTDTPPETGGTQETRPGPTESGDGGREAPNAQQHGGGTLQHARQTASHPSPRPQGKRRVSFSEVTDAREPPSRQGDTARDLRAARQGQTRSEKRQEVRRQGHQRPTPQRPSAELPAPRSWTDRKSVV